MSWLLIHRWLLFSCMSLLVFEDSQSLFLRYTQSGKCIAAGYLYSNDKYAYRYWAEMVDNCLYDSAQFQYYNNELLKDIKTGGTLLSSKRWAYHNRFVVYKGKNSAGKNFANSTEQSLKQTSSGSLFRYKKNICGQPYGKYVIREQGTCSGVAEQKFTFGSVTDYDAKMNDVSCSSIQRMLIKRADYGDFNNGGVFDFSASVDKNCSSLTTCKVKNLCGGNRSCELTVDSNLLSPYCTYHPSKELYIEYTCVDSYYFNITGAHNIRLSTSPSEGFIEITGIELITKWRKVDDNNWDEDRHKMLCQHLGFNETERNNVITKQLGSGQDIATGDLICYDTQSNGTSCCIHLEPSTTTSTVDMPYATCKICDNPLLQNVTTFPDSVFSGSGGSSKYEEARFSNDGWCGTGSGAKYLLIDLQREYHITKVVTLGDKDQTKWSGSYSLKYSRNETLVDQSSSRQITRNQNGYQASTTILDIYNVRYMKIESSGNTDFCLRIELCGEVQLPARVENIITKPSNFSVHLSWTIPGPKDSSYITHFIIFLDGKEYQTIPREKYGNHTILRGHKPHTDYAVGVQTQDGSLQRSRISSKFFKTKEAVPSGPPLGVVFSSRGINLLEISWKAPDKSSRNGVLTGYRLCIFTTDTAADCSILKSNTFAVHGLKPGTKYFVTVAARTSVGYGNKSLEISKITNGEPVNPVATTYSSLSFNITKPAQYIKEVMVIIKGNNSSPTPSEGIETNGLKPCQEYIQDPYVTAYLKADVLPLTFVIGDGKEYNSETQKYLNHPLRQNTSYIVFLRFFESQDSYYSTEWSSSVKTMVKRLVLSEPPIDVVLKSRGKHSLEVSWKAPPNDGLQIVVLTGYQVCYSTRNDTIAECLVIKSTVVVLLHIRPSSKYFVTVAAGTKDGYGEKSLAISKITNADPVIPVTASSYSLAVYIPKQAEYIKGVMIIVQIAASNSTPSKDIETNELEPYQENLQDPYITAYLKADVLPFTFVIGDGKEYNSEDEKYFNQPLKKDSNYIVFLRFFESKHSYYSTEWSSLVKTRAKRPVEHGDSQNSKLSSDDETRMELLIPLVIVSFCLLLVLGVFIYYYVKQHRRLQYSNEQPSHKPSDYMSLNDIRETENVDQQLQHPTSSVHRHHAKGIDHRDQTMQYDNPSFDGYSNDD